MAEKDNAFRRMLGDKELFLRFIRRYLRHDIPDVDPEDVNLENTTFIPADLREKRSDVVYRIRRGGQEAYVYILIEHQSRVDYLMPWRLLSYMVRLWERCVQEESRAARRKDFLLPPIVPVVFYEGEAAWTAARRFSKKVRDSATFRGYVPEFEYRLVSLRDERTEDLMTDPDALSGLLYVARPFKSEDVHEVVERIRHLLSVFPDDEALLLARHLRGYFGAYAVREGLDMDAFPEETSDREGAEMMLTYIEKEIRRLKTEGREEGWQDGLLTGREEGREAGQFEMGIAVALAMLENGEPEEKILLYTGFTPEQLAEIREGRLRGTQ